MQIKQKHLGLPINSSIPRVHTTSIHQHWKHSTRDSLRTHRRHPERRLPRRREILMNHMTVLPFRLPIVGRTNDILHNARKRRLRTHRSPPHTRQPARKITGTSVQSQHTSQLGIKPNSTIPSRAYQTPHTPTEGDQTPHHLVSHRTPATVSKGAVGSQWTHVPKSSQSIVARKHATAATQHEKSHQRHHKLHQPWTL